MHISPIAGIKPSPPFSVHFQTSRVATPAQQSVTRCLAADPNQRERLVEAMRAKKQNASSSDGGLGDPHEFAVLGWNRETGRCQHRRLETVGKTEPCVQGCVLTKEIAMSFVIESGIPFVSQEGQGRTPGKFLSTIRLLEVGQSFVFEKEAVKAASNLCSREKARSPKKFTIKSLSETTARIWRTA